MITAVWGSGCRRAGFGLALVMLGCGMAWGGPLPPALTPGASPPEVQSTALCLTALFVQGVEDVFEITTTPPAIEVVNTPNLAFFDARASRIVLPHWASLDEASRSFFVGLAGEDPSAGRLFVSLFNEFLIVHELTHWLQWSVGVERDAYALEQEANEAAVAFFMAFDSGEARLKRLAEEIDASVPLEDPTPAGVEQAAYFNAHYTDLARDPASYGFYQFRWIRRAIEVRAGLAFEDVVRRIVSSLDSPRDAVHGAE